MPAHAVTADLGCRRAKGFEGATRSEPFAGFAPVRPCGLALPAEERMCRRIATPTEASS